MLFITLDEGGFICTSDKAEGSWEIKKLPKGFYDPGLFFDEDGRIYVAHGNTKILVTELDKNFAPLTKDSLVFTGSLRKGLEGTHLYKIDGYYYLYSTYGGSNGFQVALRSKNIYGPYEEKVVINETQRNVNFGIHQGALIKTQTGEWWTILFVDMGPLGRMPSLQPIEWVNGWPIAGVNGHAVITYKKPNVGKEFSIIDLPTSDEFKSQTLGMQWGWNHNPDSLNWSLTQKKGCLRLRTGKVVKGLMDAPNTLTQRIFSNYDQTIPTVGTIKLETKKMKEGDIAGLAVFQEPYAYIAVKKGKTTSQIIMVNNGVIVDSIPTNESTVLFRALASNGTRKASFEYSLDKKNFSPLGNNLNMRFSLNIFIGNRFCLFNFSTKSTGGYADFDWFKMSYKTKSNFE